MLIFIQFGRAQGQVLISEFMANNSRTLADRDGEYSDWIELYNSGVSAMNLEGWYLTDSATNLAKWRFPSVALPPNRHLVVFASGKDRGAAASELHTNFRLSTGGEYLGLVAPDGKTIVADFTSGFPVQVTDISYGVPMRQSVTRLIPVGATAKFLVPTNDVLAAGWTDPEWFDGDWQNAITGVGYVVGEQPAVSVLAGDSAAEFSGVQGQDHWLYGYYNKTADKVAGYQMEDFVPFPSGEGPHRAANFWNGTTWDWFGGDPPWTELGQAYMRPNGVNSGAEHWAIRRWVSTVNGSVSVRWQVAKQAAFGNGVTARVFHNGTQKDSVVILGQDVIGVTRTNSIAEVKTGDFLDFALAPTGTASTTDDNSDGSYLSAMIQTTNTLAGQIATSVEKAMWNVNATAYLRIPFLVSDPSQFQFLTLRMKYDGGFVAYLNGQEVARRNAPAEPDWTSSAMAMRELTDAVQFEEIDLSSRKGFLHVGANVLAIHALNASPADSDFLIVPELSATTLTVDSTAKRYFSLPTPGTPNGFGQADLGPIVVDVFRTPKMPLDDQDLVITARAAPTFHPVRQLTLKYRVMFGADVMVEMHDDGLHGDGSAGDKIYGATIPASASTPGQMVRYFITAEDSQGKLSRWPPYQDPKNSPQYYGTMVADPAVNSALPILHWFIQNRSGADSETGTRSSVFYAGEFYDNVGVNLHGQSSTSFPKKSYDFDFNRGYHFRYSADEKPVEDFNLLTTYPDKAQMRNILAYETYRDAGSTYHVAFPVRVQQNGAFYSVAHFVEDADEDYLERLGLDPRGALYKMYNTLDSSTANVEKKTRKHERNTDLQALITGLRRTGVARTQFIYDNIDIPAMVNFLAAMIITGGVDCCHKNYYAYRDTEGTGQWQYLPWDVDLTFGRNWNSANTYYDDTMFAQNGLFVGQNNALISVLYGTPAIRQMYLRRVRTLMDELLQWTNTPPKNLKYERRINELATLLTPDAALDFAKWRTWGRTQTLAQAVAILTNQYFPARRNYLFRLAEIPRAQTNSPAIAFGDIDFNPVSGNQDEEYLQLTNANAVAVDLSRWKLVGAVNHTFARGTVLPSRSSLYVSPNVVAFRARKTAPSGGQGLFVVGGDTGRLSARGGTIRLFDDAGREVSWNTYAGKPSPAQQYLRITEIMYHPSPPPAGSSFLDEDFEFIQLKNIGPVNLDVAGVRFTSGVSFSFNTGGAPVLAPGETLYLVKNPAAFTARYGRGFNLAGPYVGSLDNGGEKLRMEDAAGESVLEFGYNNSWYPSTDGQAFSLVIGDDQALWDSWSNKASWRSSQVANGSPALGSPMLKIWKTTHFTQTELANPAVSGDEADPDNDGPTNLDEFLTGTDPREARSYFKVESPELIHGAQTFVKFRFIATLGKSYSVQVAESLSRPVWTNLTNLTARTDSGFLEVMSPVEPPLKSLYFRVVTPAQP
ncbi:MAG: CotH kinase family protein [Verrucomicrobia bacterium]|nr:CotH kinase family protein [Verrucomicrobiota bacterium]